MRTRRGVPALTSPSGFVPLQRALPDMEAFIPLALTLLLMWVLLIRPQQQRIRHQQALVASLTVGDDVVTAGGMFGTITGLDEETVLLEVSPGVNIRVMRAAISRRAYDVEEEDETAGGPYGADDEEP